MSRFLEEIRKSIGPLILISLLKILDIELEDMFDSYFITFFQEHFKFLFHLIP